MRDALTAVLLPTPVPRHMSYSQSTTLADCGLKYFLERVVRAPYAPNMAAVGGKATHLATEWIDWFHDAADYFESDLTRHYGAVLRWDQTEAPPGSDPGGLEAKVGIRADNTRTATTIAYLDGVDTVESGEWVAKETVPGSVRDLWDIALSESIAEESSRAAEQYQDPTTWRVFGKATKAWPNKEDRDWWDHHGPIFIMRWLHWRLTSGFKMVFLDGDPSQPAIEVDCSGTLGGVEIKGFIDRIMLDPWGQPSPLDIKTNSKLPDVSRQLGLYRLLLEEMGFPPPAKGYAWWARSGELGPETDLTVPDLSEARMVYDLRTLRDRRNNGDFQPNTQSISCSYCGVKPFCYARDGERSNEATRPWEVSRIEIK